MIRFTILLCLLSIGYTQVFAQLGTINGQVYNATTNEAVPFANVSLQGTSIGATSDVNGEFRIDNIKPGSYNILCSYVGFEATILYEIIVGSIRPTSIEFRLKENITNLKAVEVISIPFSKTEESPVSLRTISASEIYRNPGGNRDISKVIQSFPGVSSSTSFRNDIIIRGGAPNENRFYLDGIEVPVINHFSTQGSSGGPVGMINVNFIREVDFYAGAFKANRSNALSSVMEFKQIDGNTQKLKGTFALGSSDVGLTLDGPLGKKSSFIFSARRSYLQFLFKALALPFLPTYNDFQFKQTIKINQKNKITLIGLAAIDDFSLNQSVNDGIEDEETLSRNNYILGNLPTNTQWNYTIGGKWQHFDQKGFQNFVLSRSHLNNQSFKFIDNIETTDNKILDYSSEEIENKFRFENILRKGSWKWDYGFQLEHAIYKNATYSKKQIGGEIIEINFDSQLSINKMGAYAQVSKPLFENRLQLSLGLRTDIADYSTQTTNPLEQISPRFSASYNLTEKISLNGNTGIYYQMPAYTVLGYRNINGDLVNKSNGVKYIRAIHYVLGGEYNPNMYTKISVEGFYKKYGNYPFLTNDSISLANLGGDFGVIGNEEIVPTSFGKSYGLELLVQQKLSSSIYGILAYTIYRSQFSDKNEALISASWDNVHILNITAGKKFKNNWEIGLKFRLLGGAPYTPINIALSSQKQVWDVTRQGVLDYNQLNSQRFKFSHGMDIRIDKKWFFKKWAVNLYLDVQNVYNFQAQQQAYLNVKTDVNGLPLQDPNNPDAYQTYLIQNTAGTLLPSVGLMIEF